MSKILYIPTTSLNFNNIMSSESISPAAFYKLRGYGYKNFEKVPLNCLDNVITLYADYPVFSIESELESYPMVIAIPMDCCPTDLEEVRKGVYLCSETIYLNPLNTTFFFNKKEELITTQSKSIPSIEAKLANFYKGCCQVFSQTAGMHSGEPYNLKDKDLNKQALAEDKKLNKLKGFLYAYMIAYNKSLPSDVVSLKMHIKQLINKLSAILTDSRFRTINLRGNEVSACYHEIAIDIERIEGVYGRTMSLIEERLQSSMLDSEILKKWLISEGLFDDWCSKIKEKYSLKSKYAIHPFIPTDGQDKIVELDRYTQYLNSLVSSLTQSTMTLCANELPAIKDSQILNIPNQKDVAVKILNQYLNDMVGKDDFLHSRYESALKGCKLFKESMGEKWEESSAKTYVNSLLKNLNEYTEFNINSTNNAFLKSFAAFFQKGDKETERLEDYLIANGIGDFKISFALWGIVFGFADLPKTFTSSFYNASNQDYVLEMYKSIYRTLWAKELKEIKDETTPSDDVKLTTKKEGGILQTVSSVVGEIKSLFDKDKSNDSPQNIIEMPECLKPYFDDNTFKKMNSEAQDWCERMVLSLWSGVYDSEFYKALKEQKCPIKGQKGKYETWLKILPKISKPKDGTIKRSKKAKAQIDENNLFSNGEWFNQSTGYFLSDYNYLANDIAFRNLVSSIHGWQKDLQWFIDAHNPSHPDYKYYKGKPTDNRTLVNQYISLQKDKYRIAESYLKNLYKL